VFDTDKDNQINLTEFMRMTDLLVNGSDAEKNQFSFALMDECGEGIIDFEEFCSYF